MEKHPASNYFLGANSAGGFFSLYGGFCPPESGVFLWIIKGGPGCGKSSFMKRIGAEAERAGMEVHYVWCSGDPDSLDAVYVPEARLAYADGTAPHVLEVPYPGASGLYLDLGRFYDQAALRPELQQIAAVGARIRALYKELYRGLGLLADAEKPLRGAPSGPAPVFSPSRAGSGRLLRRFGRALTCRGLIGFDSLPDRVQALPSPADVEQTARSAAAAGYDVVCLQHPLFPALAEAAVIPELSLACAARLDEAEALFAPALEAAARKLSAAKALHDELEAIYNPHVDFEGVYETAARHASALKK